MSDPVAESRCDAPAPAAPRRRRRWLRWSAYLLIALVLLVVGARIALPLVLPSIVDKLASGYGLRCDYERLSLSILSGDVEIWHVSVRPREGGQEYVHLEYARIDVDLSSLLSSQPLCRRVEVDGLDVQLHRLADGTFAFERHFATAAAGAEPAPEPEPPDEAEPADTLDLTLPVRVDALRLQHVELRLRDDYLPPSIDARYELNLRVSDLGHPARETRFDLQVSSHGALDSLSLEGRVRLAGRTLDARADLRVYGWRPGAYRGEYLKQFGVVPCADEVDARLGLIAEGRPSGPDGKRLALGVIVQEVEFLADRRRFLAVERAGLRAEGLRPDALIVDFLGVRGVRAAVALSPEGALEVGPFRFLQPARLEEPAATQGIAALLAMARARVDTRFGNAGVREVRVRDVELSVHDASMPEPVNLTARLEDLRIRGRSIDTALGARNVAVSARVAVPNVVERIQFEGMLSMLHARKVLQLDVSASGIGLEGVAQYLAAAGITPAFAGGSFDSEVWLTIDAEDEAHIRAYGGMEQVALRDGAGALLLGLESARIDGYLHELRRGVVSVDEITVEGVRLAARREGDVLASCGLRIGPVPAADPTPMAQPATATRDFPKQRVGDDVVPLRRVSVGRFAYEDVLIALEDATESPARKLKIETAGELRDLSVPLLDDHKPLATSVLSGWCKAPGLLDRLVLKGRVGIQPGAVLLNLGVQAEGFTGRILGPYLAPLGLEPVMTSGTADGVLTGSVRFGGGVLAADLDLAGVRLSDGEEELLAADEIRVRDVEIRDDLVRLGVVHFEHPRIRVHQETDGMLRAVGYRTLPPVVEAREKEPPAREPAKVPAPPAPDTVGDARPLAIRIDRFQVRDAVTAWFDHQTDPDLALEATGSLELTGLVLGRAAPPARLRCGFSLPGMIDYGELRGVVKLGPSAQGFQLDLGVNGIRLDSLAPYLTAPCARSLRDGRLHASIEGATSTHGKSARALDLQVRAVDFRDGEDGPSLFKLEAMKLRVPTLDLIGGLIDIDELSIEGLEARLERTAAGSLRPCGILLPEAEAVADAGPPVGAQPPAPRVPRGRIGSFPLVKLTKLDLNLRRFTITDARFPDADPIVFADVRLTNKKPIQVLGKDAESNEATQLRIEGGVHPLVQHFEVDLTASPFDGQPDMQIEVSATGVDGDGITRVRPDLASRVNGLPLKDGHFEMKAGLVLHRRSRHALDFNLDTGFGLEFVLRDLVFRREAGGPPLAGVGEVDVVVKRIVPATGEVWIKSIEIGEPVGQVVLADDGLHLLGIVVKLPEPAAAQASGAAASLDPPAVTSQQSTAVAEKSAGPAQPAALASSGSAPAKTPAGELRLDRFEVTGLDFRIEDRTVDPPFVLPLENLDLELRGFSTRNWQEKRPLRFQARVASGKVDIGARKAAPVEGGKATERPRILPRKASPAKPVDERVAFQELLVRGELFFAPTRHGWIKTDLSMMDLAAFQGLAARSGVEIHEGVFDADVLVLLREDATMDLDADLAFTGLSMTEPPDGLIARYLRLPAPLDSVIFFIRDENATIRLPLSFSMGASGGISTAQITQEAVKALGLVITNALAASPFRLVGTVTDPLGITGGGKENTAGDPVRIEFSTGATAVNSASRAVLAVIARRLRAEPNLALNLRAEVGRGDAVVARVRANPSRRDCLALIHRLRERRERLFAFREVMLRRGRAALAARLDPELDELVGRLKAYDRELARIEASIDRLGDLVRPGAERMASRRTRAAGTAIAEARLVAVKQALLDEIGVEFEHRIRISRPRFRVDTEVAVGTVEVQPTISSLERRAAPKMSEPVNGAQTAR